MNKTVISSILVFFALSSSASPGKNKLVIRENVGQLVDQNGIPRKDLDFFVKDKNLEIFVGCGRMQYQWLKPRSGDPATFDYSRLDVELLGANPDVKPEAEEPAGHPEHYYLPHCYARTALGFKRIRYRDVYPGIDWVIYIEDGGLKYDFIVHKGGDLALIKLSYGGARKLRLQNEELLAETTLGTLTENKPFAYRLPEKTAVAASYLLAGNVMGFSVGKADGDLVIDPALEWATYFGGIGTEYLPRVITGPQGGVCAGGKTLSPGLATTGAYQGTISVGSDAYIVKFDSSGNCLWATYYGGAGMDEAYDLCEGPGGNFYICGRTESQAVITTPGVFQPGFSGSGGGNAFLSCFTSAGALLWGTYYAVTIGINNYPGSFNHLAADASGSVYAVGDGSVTNAYLVTPGAYQMQNNGMADALLVKFNASGQRVWATYFGGSGFDGLYAITCDTSANVYICGNTTSAADIATPGAWQNTCVNCGSGPGDAYLVKFDSSGSRLWGTYFGGPGSDAFQGLAADRDNNVYAVGGTASVTGIASPGCHQPLIGNPLGGIDGMVVKFNPGGTRIWSTYYGGEEWDVVTDVAIKGNTEVFIGGSTHSATNIATDTTYAGAPLNLIPQMFMAQFDSGGQRLYGTYFGGIAHEDGNSLAYSEVSRHIYLAGNCASTGLATAGSYQPVNNGGPGGQNFDGLIVCFHDSSSTISVPTVSGLICTGSTVNVVNNASGYFGSGNVFTVQLSDAAGSFASSTVIGTATGNIPGAISCFIPAATPAGTNYRIRILSSQPIQYSTPTASIQIAQPTSAVISISAIPGTSIASGTLVTFTANVTNGGANPFYQWKKNSAGIPGATNSTYSTSQISTGDGFSVQVLSSEPCALPAQSNLLTMQVTNAVAGVDQMDWFTVYPNPFADAIAVNGPAGGTFHIRLADLTGRVVFEQTDQTVPAILYLELARGVYICQIGSLGRTQTVRLLKY